MNLSNLKGLSNFIFTNCTQIHIINLNKDENNEGYVAINALLDGGSEVTLILDSVASECNLKILGVVDLVLSTVSGNIKKEVFKYEIVLKNEENPADPIVTFTLGLDTLGNCKLPSEEAKNQLLNVLEPMGKTLSDVNWSTKAQIELIIGLDNTDLLPVEEWKHYKKPQNLSFRKSKVVKNPYPIGTVEKKGNNLNSEEGNSFSLHVEEHALGTKASENEKKSCNHRSRKGKNTRQ